MPQGIHRAALAVETNRRTNRQKEPEFREKRQDRFLGLSLLHELTGAGSIKRRIRNANLRDTDGDPD